MAATDQGNRLTEAHRQAQLQISAETLALFVVAWRLLDLERVRETFPDYFRAVKAIVTNGRRRSAALAAAYYRALRDAEGIRGEVRVIQAVAEIPDAQLAASLMATGPRYYEYASRVGNPRAAEIALEKSGSAVTRHTLNGGRETITQTGLADPAAEGFARVTDGDPCAFCAMLASRGAVYKSEATANFKPHDRCGCQPEPVFDVQRYKMTPHMRELNALWVSSTAGKSGKDAVNAFRRALGK